MIALNCGEHNRVIQRVGDVYYIGCFRGNYDEAYNAIFAKYGEGNYIEKLKQCRDYTIDDVKNKVLPNATDRDCRYLAEYGRTDEIRNMFAERLKEL